MLNKCFTTLNIGSAFEQRHISRGHACHYTIDVLVSCVNHRSRVVQLMGLRRRSFASLSLSLSLYRLSLNGSGETPLLFRLQIPLKRKRQVSGEQGGVASCASGCIGDVLLCVYNNTCLFCGKSIFFSGWMIGINNKVEIQSGDLCGSLLKPDATETERRLG